MRARRTLRAMRLPDLTTPALLVDADSFEHNVGTMAAALPGARLRPHVKAFKSTAIARELVAAGHRGFCCATVREMEGMAAAGLGGDLLLANEVLDARRLGALVRSGAGVTVAVDSELTVEAAAAGGVERVLIDVNVGLPRCGCAPQDAGRLAELARSRGLEVVGVMGYEGLVAGEPDRATRVAGVESAMALLRQAHADVGGDIVSGGSTGTYDCNPWVSEVQAGSYVLMDTAYDRLGLPFRPALTILATVVSAGVVDGVRYLVADAGLKAHGMDHGNPSIAGAAIWFCSDEHVTFSVDEAATAEAGYPRVGDRVRLVPAHVDPTVAYHERMHLVRGDEVIETWAVDLRGW
jgi:D-threonine aldolase